MNPSRAISPQNDALHLHLCFRNYQENTMMDKATMTETIIATKIEKGLSWETMGKDLGMSPVWLTSACLGMNSAPA